MTKILDYIFWLFVAIRTSVFVIFFYPLFILKNIGHYMKAPSVLLYATVFFALDRITKLIILYKCHLLPLRIIKDFFTLTYVKNPGVAFGLFPDWRLPPILMALVMVLIITYYSFHLPAKERLTRWSLALLVGGALGNLYDRIIYGFVVDFFLFHFGKVDFPVFNFADVAIDLGVFLLFLDIFILGTDEPSPGNRESHPAPSAA